MNEQNRVYSSKSEHSTRVKVDSWKKTVGITLPQNLLERARKRNLNISRITEQALTSILDYMETQNIETSSEFLSSGSFPKKVVASPPGIEPGTPGFLRGFRLKARCSVLTELRALCGPCLSVL